ncbi:hypothetical protein BJV74DRAFT_844244 [Russula compacta]|nr:hypothetical protein BJV74DRAFT_844244 [Russula compacta]
MNDNIPQAYTAAGAVDDLQPNDRWEVDQTITRHAKGLWDALKALFEGRLQDLVMDLPQTLQQAKCEETGNLRTHFGSLVDLREQLAAMGQTPTMTLPVRS